MIIVRVHWEGQILSNHYFDDDRPHTAEAFYSSTIDYYTRSDEGEGVTVQLIDDEGVCAEKYIPYIS